MPAQAQSEGERAASAANAPGTYLTPMMVMKIQESGVAGVQEESRRLVLQLLNSCNS
jgi:hypothetical protein